MKLTVTDNGDRHCRIESNYSELDGVWEDIYFNVSGYFANIDPHVFASAPKLLDLLKDVRQYIDTETIPLALAGEIGEIIRELEVTS